MHVKGQTLFVYFGMKILLISISEKDLDLVILGSDQIWNPFCIKDSYLGKLGDIDCKIISYSASFGVDNIEMKFYKDYENLKKLESISLREISNAKFLKDIFDIDFIKTVDPVFLLDSNHYDEIAGKSALNNKDFGPYNFVFMLGNNNFSKVRKTTNKDDKKTIIFPLSRRLSQYFNNAVFSCNYDVSDFLWYIKNADKVYTDSFHVICFCLIFNVPFIYMPKHSSKSKKSENVRILELLNLDKNNLDCLVKQSKEYLKREVK